MVFYIFQISGPDRTKIFYDFWSGPVRSLVRIFFIFWKFGINPLFFQFFEILVRTTYRTEKKSVPVRIFRTKIRTTYRTRFESGPKSVPRTVLKKIRTENPYQFLVPEISYRIFDTKFSGTVLGTELFVQKQVLFMYGTWYGAKIGKIKGFIQISKKNRSKIDIFYLFFLIGIPFQNPY